MNSSMSEMAMPWTLWLCPGPSYKYMLAQTEESAVGETLNRRGLGVQVKHSTSQHIRLHRLLSKTGRSTGETKVIIIKGLHRDMIDKCPGKL